MRWAYGTFRASTSFVAFGDTCLAAARSRHGSDMPPACHSLPWRHCVTLKGKPRTTARRGRRALRCNHENEQVVAPYGMGGDPPKPSPQGDAKDDGAPSRRALRCNHENEQVVAPSGMGGDPPKPSP